MHERFLPWSSVPGDALSPRLSTFWKRPLTSLASARAARLKLTRRDWLKLGALGTAACALPTIHLASAGRLDDAEKGDAGKLYVPAQLITGNAQHADNGILAIDPKTASWHKLIEYFDDVRVSRDGRMLALMRWFGRKTDGQGADRAGVWTLSADGTGEKRRIASFAGATSWSPDGKQVIVSKGLSGPEDDSMRWETWRFNVDGSSAIKLPVPETDNVSDWSPDGKWFLTCSDRHPPHGSGYQLYIMHPDGGDQRRLTNDHGLNCYARFSPDSRRIAYAHQEHGENSLWIVNIDGTGRRRLVNEGNDTFPEHVCWSPDGKSLAYTLIDQQRDEKGKEFLDPEKSTPRISIISEDGMNNRPLPLPLARSIGSLDWR